MNIWHTFKKLREAILNAETKGARVAWGDQIEDCRFDATLRLALSSHDFLIVVDCIVTETPLLLEDVEAFAVKSNKVLARMAILASSAGFTQEAIDFATKNDIRLIALATIQRLPLEALSDAFNLVLHAHSFRFLWADGSGETALPEEPEILSFSCAK